MSLEAMINEPIDAGPVPVPTKTELMRDITEDWRAGVRNQMVARETWIMLAVSYLLLAVGCLMIEDPLMSILAIATTNTVALLVYRHFYRHDRHYRTLSQLTPVIDRTILKGEIAVLNGAVAFLIAMLKAKQSSADERVRCVEMTLDAALPILKRGGLTIETAQASGYPAFPEVDRTELPFSDGDFASIHLMKVNSVMERILKADESDVVLAESIAQVTGEMIPPLRALRAAIAG